jgi:hypothetical protein
MSADRAYYSFINHIKTKLTLVDSSFKYYEERVPEDETSPYLHFSRGGEFINNRLASCNCQAWVIVNALDTEPPHVTLDKAINKIKAITLDNGPMSMFDHYQSNTPHIGYYDAKLTEISQRSAYDGKASCVMTWVLTAIDTTPSN